MKLNTIFLTLILTFFAACPSKAWKVFEDVHMKARLGYSIGGTTPIGLPSTIRGIESFRLTPNFLVGFDAMRPISSRFGVQVGLHLEIKDMDGEVTTKGYRMKVKMDDDELEGLYTGHVRQKVRQSMFTIPVLATYELSRKVQLKVGPYLSLLFHKRFYGYAFDGYLRKDDPTGSKVIMGDKEGEWATYDFDDEMRICQFGMMAGVDWNFYRQFGMSADLSWGLTGIHHSDFKTVEQTLFPIYGTIGIFYKIK